jgi:hypothetical protein
MLHRMSFFSRLIVLSLSGFAGCVSKPNELRIPSRDNIYVEGNINPQSRGHRGGALENFGYFFAEDDRVPPQKLPARVTGHLYGFGDVEIDLTDKNVDSCVTSGVVPIYDVRVQTTEGMINPCAQMDYRPGPDDVCSADQISSLHERAIAVPGAWSDEDGQYYETKDGKQVFTLACMTGIAAKCVHWGYPPWGTSEGRPLADYFAACTHAARAEYRSDTAYTCTGTLIDVYDRLSIQRPSTQSSEPLLFEAAWGKDGPVCINHPRFPACAADEVVEQMPRCDEAALSGENSPRWPEGVLLVTRSTGDNQTRDGECPNRPELCSL